MAAVAVLVLAGCGGGDEKKAPAESAAQKPEPAASADEFADRFEKLTSVRLDVGHDPFGTRLDEPDGDDTLGYRLSGYTYYWTGDDSERGILLEGEAGPDDTVFERIDRESWSIAKGYGPRLVVSYVGADRKAPTAEWERLDRLSQAAYSGDLSVLEPGECPCAESGIDPLRGGDGKTCAVDGIPVTSVDGRDALVTPVIEARVLGMSTSGEVGVEGSVVPPQSAQGTYVVVAYRLRNAGDRPIRFLRTALRIGDRTYPEDAGASAFLPRSRAMPLPLPPGEEIETEVAFDVPSDFAARAGREGAVVLPADHDELGDPNIEFAQGWVRLAHVPDSLPQISQPAPPNQPPPPEGPPPIPLERGDGPPIGGTARRLYTANSFFPVPKSFVPGGVNVGNRAGACTVPRVDARVRRSLLATVRHDTPRKDGRVARLPDRQILLAGCGGAGRWAMVSWVGKGGSRGPVIFVDEFQWRGGAWHGSPKGRWPGCGIPADAAAAWQIDISHCDRGQQPGEVS